MTDALTEDDLQCAERMLSAEPQDAGVEWMPALIAEVRRLREELAGCIEQIKAVNSLYDEICALPNIAKLRAVADAAREILIDAGIAQSQGFAVNAQTGTLWVRLRAALAALDESKGGDE